MVSVNLGFSSRGDGGCCASQGKGSKRHQRDALNLGDTVSHLSCCGLDRFRAPFPLSVKSTTGSETPPTAVLLQSSWAQLGKKEAFFCRASRNSTLGCGALWTRWPVTSKGRLLCEAGEHCDGLDGVAARCEGCCVLGDLPPVVSPRHGQHLPHIEMCFWQRSAMWSVLEDGGGRRGTWKASVLLLPA